MPFISAVIEYEHSTSLCPACTCRDKCATRKAYINWSAVQSSKCAPCTWITRTRISGINLKKIRNEQGNPKTLYVWVKIFNWAISYYQPFVGFFMLGQGFFSSLRAQTACEEPTLASHLTGASCYFSGVQRQERDANCWCPYWPSTKIIMLKKCFHFPCSYTVCLFRRGATFP